MEAGRQAAVDRYDRQIEAIEEAEENNGGAGEDDGEENE